MHATGAAPIILANTRAGLLDPAGSRPAVPRTEAAVQSSCACKAEVCCTRWALRTCRAKATASMYCPRQQVLLCSFRRPSLLQPPHSMHPRRSPPANAMPMLRQAPAAAGTQMQPPPALRLPAGRRASPGGCRTVLGLRMSRQCGLAAPLQQACGSCSSRTAERRGLSCSRSRRSRLQSQQARGARQ